MQKVKEHKPTMGQLFKGGENFHFKKIDYSSAAITIEVMEIQRRRSESLHKFKDNYSGLTNIRFTI